MIRHHRRLFLLFLLAATPAFAQIRLARIPGEPGAFGAASNVVFTLSGAVGYVSNSGSGTLLKFRPSTGEIVASVQLTPGIGALTLSYDERTLAVVGVTSQRVYIIDAGTMTVRWDMGYQPSGFNARTNPLLSRDASRVFVADPSQNRVAIFNTGDGLFDHFINVGINPTVMNALPDGRFVTVLCSGKKAGDEESVWLLDTFTLASFDVRPLTSFNTEPFNNVQFTIDGSLAYIPSYNDNRIGVFDRKTFVLGSRGCKGEGPTRAFSSPNGRFLALINAKSRSVALFRLPEVIESDAVSITDPDMEFAPDDGLAWSSDSHTLYIPLSKSGRILAYDVENLKVQGTFATGKGPAILTMSPSGEVLTSLDLAGNELSLIAAKPKTLFIPHLAQNSKEYSGIALANFGTEAANVAFSAHDNTGALLPGTGNPHIVTVSPGKTLSLVAWQLFGFDPSVALEGYINAYTLGASVSILYLSGTVNQTQLDGFIPDSVTGKLLGFSRITEGVSKFGAPTSTEIILENPTNTDANLLIRMYARTLEGPGTLVAYLNRVLRAGQRLKAPVSTLVPTAPWPQEHAYLAIDSDVAIKGMEIVRIGDSMAMLPAWVRGTPISDFLGVQFASGGAAVLDTPIFSSLSFCNSSPSDSINVTIEVTDANGKPVPEDAQPVTISLLPFEAVSGGADELLGFPDPLLDPDLYQGTIRITVDKPGVLLDLLYGDARNGRYLTSADLNSVQGTKFALPHYAEGLFGDPPKGLYTGVALYNPNRAIASIVIEAFDPDGEFLGKGNLIMPANTRLAKTIGQLVSAITQQNGGTVVITSDLPIYLFEVFGSTTSDFLVSVTPVLLAP